MAKGNAKQLLTMGSSRWDGLLLFVLMLVTLYLDKFAPPHVQPADLSDPSLQHPHRPDIVPASYLLLLSFLGPVAIFCALELRGLRVKQGLLLLFATGLLEANVLTVLLANALKLLIGRPRPYFAAVCGGYEPGSDTQCVGNAHAVAEARKSFPSGHSSLAFAAAVFLACYLALRLGLGRASAAARTWQMCVVLTAPFAAALVAASRTVDYHHHHADVVAGAVIGTAVAMTVFHGRKAELAKLGEMVDMEEMGELGVDGGARYETIVGEESV